MRKKLALFLIVFFLILLNVNYNVKAYNSYWTGYWLTASNGFSIPISNSNHCPVCGTYNYSTSTVLSTSPSCTESSYN